MPSGKRNVYLPLASVSPYTVAEIYSGWSLNKTLAASALSDSGKLSTAALYAWIPSLVSDDITTV